jgi:FkbM family methyltransferase
MSIRRVAVIFDNKLRPDTTGGYCLRALQGLVDVEHFPPADLARVPREGFDLYLTIDDGLDYPLRPELRPSAWWAIDTHLNGDWCLNRAPGFDLVFTAQRDGAERMQDAGIDSAAWLPLACDPEIHRKYDVAKEYDVCFVGHLFAGPRADLLDLLRRRFPRHFVGERYFEEMARTYSASRVIFNRSIVNDINMRVFEALACGSLLLTNDLSENGQEDLFRDGVHLATYRSSEELLDKAAYYLKREEVREKIAAAGRTEVLNKDTYRHCMEFLLREAERGLAKVAVPVVVAPPAADPPAVIVERPGAAAAPQGEPAVAAGSGLTSIVIPVHNQLDFTRQCLESIRAHTPEAHEVIVVDNGSSDGTAEYLRSLPGVKVVQNDTNRGFPAAVNQGIREAVGRQVLLLNNDCVVTPGWLGRLLAALHREPTIGLAGPCTNRISGEQQVPARYETIEQLEAFTREWGRANDRRLVDTDRLVGFCLLIRRAAIEKIGLFDEQFGVGCFEDDDFCRRALQAGFRAVIAVDSFVHHYGSQTFRATGIDFAALMAENGQRFREKWQDRIELSACIIGRDNARTIRACLESIRPWVDEIIFVDTGSKDETPGIAEQLGACVFHFEWCDSFSAARNESLRHARGKWVFWMDTDDTVDPENGSQLRPLIRRATPDVLGYTVSVRCPERGTDGAGDYTDVTHVKLFRNLPELRFERRIHEQIIPAIRRQNGEIVGTPLFVVHSGYDTSPEGQKRKLDRDLRLLHKELEEEPEHPFTLFNLGMTYNDCKEYARAVDYLRRSIRVSGEGESHLRKAFAYLVSACSGLGQLDDAWHACADGLRMFPRDEELRFRKGVLLHQRGELREAVAAFEDVLQNRDEWHFTSVVRGITGYLTRANLALVYRDLGEPGKEEEQWRRVIAEVPGYRPGWNGLGETLVRQGRLAEAAVLARGLLHDARVRSVGLVLEARLARARGEGQKVRSNLEQAVREFPEDLVAREEWCHFLFEHGTPADAAGALAELVRCDPENASAHHNLGLKYLELGRATDAVAAMRESLRLRPDYDLTRRALSEALAAVERGPAGNPMRQHRLRVQEGAAEVCLSTRGPVDDSIVCQIWERDVYGVRELTEAPAVVVDIGAHIGAFALLARMTWPESRVIACEADPDNVRLLEQNVNGHTGLEIVPAAVLGEERTEVEFRAVLDKVWGNSGGGSCVRPEPGTQTIRAPAISVRRLWAEKGITACDLLKLDCEGCEVPLLRVLAESGQLRTVRCITGEWHTSDDRAESRERVRRELRTILAATHEVTFSPDRPGREGYFTARLAAHTSTAEPVGLIRVALLSFLFNWPSTGGGIVHTVELGQFLGRAGYAVEHFYARFPAWGIGGVESPVPFPSTPLDFDEATWNRDAIQARFRAAVDRFRPDYVILTDSWNMKPVLAEALRGYPYVLRFQAMECLCPLNNVRLLSDRSGGLHQCPRHQLATPAACVRCVQENGRFSGALHQAERALSGVGTSGYHERLVRVLAEAEAVLVVNPLHEAMLGPYSDRVRVVTAGMDPARFPVPWPDDPADRRDPKRPVLFFAGLVEERIKGFDVLHAACARLWQRRQDFELLATGDPVGGVNAFTRFVGWQSQESLPRHLRAADIVVVPTVAQEALGRTAVEAMAAARSVIASRLGGLPFTVADGATGLLCEPGDVEDLACKIERLLDDPALRHRLGEAGRRRFEEHYAWPVIIEKHYKPLLCRRS